MNHLAMKALLFAITAVAYLAAGPSAKADPLFFSNVVALQNNAATRVDLFSNPGTTLLGPQLSFLVDITGMVPPGDAPQTLLITYLELGGVPITQTFQIPAFATVPPPYTQLFTITSPGASAQGAMARLTIDILGSAPDFVIPGGPGAGQRVDSYTYTFNVAKPVPEPVSLILFGTGVLGVWRRTSKPGGRRRRH